MQTQADLPEAQENLFEIKALKLRIPEADDDLLESLIEEASEYIKAYTNRKKVPKGLSMVTVRLAVAFFNAMGMEGEARHTEGVETRAFSGIPLEIEKALKPYRLLDY